MELSPLSYPDSTKGLNEFTRYSLDSLLIVSDTIFVGWKQTTEEFLNLGYDINNANKKNILTNITGNWIPFNSSPYIEGSLMIRLICGTRQLTTSVKGISKTGEELINLYPNPATEYINIQFPALLNDYPLSISIYDFFGKLVYLSDEITPVINISGLKPGLYILRVSGQRFKAINKKFIISR